MLKAIVLLLLSLPLWGADEQHATISLQRWNNKLVVSINHDEGWHTYWKNPGDAGIANTFKFLKETKAYEWPAPKKYLEAGDILTIGYSGTSHFFFDDIPGPVDLQVGVLICKDICIPGEAKLKLNENTSFISNRTAQPYPTSQIEKAFNELPEEIALPKGFEYYLTREKNQPKLTLHYMLKGHKNISLPKELNLLSGLPYSPWGYKRETLFVKDNILYGKTEIEWDGEYQEPPLSLPNSGEFSQAYNLKFLYNGPDTNKPNIITLSVKNFSNATSDLLNFYNKMPTFNGKSSIETSMVSEEKNIFKFILFAFLGGLILNLMPCVLPVISLKLFGLIKHQSLSKKKIIFHNLAYTAGILSTFMGLGLVIALIKRTGEQVGWGFQLQSPSFILLMMLILFILSLNLFGLFEFITPGGSKLGSATIKDNMSGDFFSGVLTTILSTPCSAPFLGTALTFAFTTQTFNIFLIFFFIGLGLAFPFLITAIFPQSLAIFPKPGLWMEKLKYILGLSLIVTVVWLYDVFVSLVDFSKVNWRLNLLFVSWFFAFFFVKKMSKSRIVQLLVFLFPLLLTIMAIQDLPLRPSEMSITATEGKWSPWSISRLNEEKGNFVFIDFTAEWCLTCKVNKKLVLETDAFNELAKDKKITLLRADWTKRDDDITNFLKSYNVVGVPAYFLQTPDGKIIHLGETISVEKLEKSLQF